MWLDISFIADVLDGNADFTDIDRLDMNSDGELTAEDCIYPHGSPEAKLWWKNIMEPYAKSQSDPAWTEQYGDKVVGGYKGKPLVPGVKGSASNPQGDFDFLSDKIKVTQGLSTLSAKKIAAKVMWSKF